MATQLSLYNEALLILGERKLASLTEDREPRRVMDTVWDYNTINHVLEQGQWNFATRSAKLEPNPSMEQAFGLAYAYEKPTDFVRLTAMCTDEYYSTPLLGYTEEGGFWFADIDEIYIKYVSNDASYGSDLSLWPETFVRYVAHYLAFRSVKRISQNQTDKDDLEKDMKKALSEARSKDALAQPTEFLPEGQWVKARRGRRAGRSNDRGSRSRLTG